MLYRNISFIIFNIIGITNLMYILSYKIINDFYQSCIVIRVDKVTPTQLKRYISWRKTFPLYYNFFLLSMKIINASLLTKYNINNVVVSFAEVLSVYPNVIKLKGNCSKYKSSRLISWISHTESLSLFYSKLKYKYSYLWIIEQDVGYLGNLYNFVDIYKNSKKDLITISIKNVTSSWVWFNCATENYLQRRNVFFKENVGYSNREYVQRWSKLYISKLSYDLQNYYHSQTETSTFELTLYYNLSYEEIPKKYIGSHFCAGKSITRKEWIKLIKNKKNHFKFYHPLKF